MNELFDDSNGVYRTPCRNDPELFFRADRKPGEKPKELEPAAKKVCGECALQLACLKFALANPKVADVGIWGRLTTAERKKLTPKARRSG